MGQALLPPPSTVRGVGFLLPQKGFLSPGQQLAVVFGSKDRPMKGFSLQEFKRKAEFSEWDDDGDEDMEDGGVASSEPDDLGEAEPQGEKLHVFTVSSTEYLKLSGKLLRDGPPQVFHDPKDTGMGLSSRPWAAGPPFCAVGPLGWVLLASSSVPTQWRTAAHSPAALAPQFVIPKL